MKVVQIVEADIYRDGGSYGFRFDADDGRTYEFVIRIRVWEHPREITPTASYHAPAIYLEKFGNGSPIREMTWDEGRKFLSSLHFENERFNELVRIVLMNAAH